MKESLLGRVGRIVSGSFQSIVSALENVAPEIVSEKAITEIDDAVDEVRQELGKVMAKKHLASTRLGQENQRHEELSEQVEVALSEQREDLAEVAVAAQLDIEAQIPVLESTVSDCATQEKELEGYIEALLAKKRQMKDELRAYRESQQQVPDVGSPTAGASGGGSVEGRVTKAESAFERVMEKASGLAGSSRTLDRKNASQMAELEELTRKNRIQERLAVIKSRVGKE